MEMNIENIGEKSIIELEDQNDPHLAGLNWNNISATNIDLYLQVADIRKKASQPEGDILDFAKRIEDLSEVVKKSARVASNNDEKNFLAMAANKLAILSLRLQMAQRAEQVKNKS